MRIGDGARGPQAFLDQAAKQLARGGETLGQMASRLGLDPQKLAAANPGIDSGKLLAAGTAVQLSLGAGGGPQAPGGLTPGGDVFENAPPSPFAGLLPGAGLQATVAQPAGAAAAAVPKEVVSGITRLMASGDGGGAVAAFRGAAERLAQQGGSGNVVELLQLVVKEAIRENSEDKKHFLGKLKDANQVAAALGQQLGDLAEASQRLAAREAAGTPARTGDAADPPALIQSVLREAYLEAAEDLKAYAGKVETLNEAKKGIRDELGAVRGSLGENLQAVGDDAQLANVDLQDALQKQQQMLQMISNISKQLSDTATAVIRKLGG